MHRFRVGLLAAISGAAATLVGDCRDWVARLLITAVVASTAGLAAGDALSPVKKNA